MRKLTQQMQMLLQKHAKRELALVLMLAAQCSHDRFLQRGVFHIKSGYC